MELPFFYIYVFIVLNISNHVKFIFGSRSGNDLPRISFICIFFFIRFDIVVVRDYPDQSNRRKFVMLCLLNDENKK